MMVKHITRVYIALVYTALVYTPVFTRSIFAAFSDILNQCILMLVNGHLSLSGKCLSRKMSVGYVPNFHIILMILAIHSTCVVLIALPYMCLFSHITLTFGKFLNYKIFPYGSDNYFCCYRLIEKLVTYVKFIVFNIIIFRIQVKNNKIIIIINIIILIQ